MKISICIPIYNVEAYLQECLESVVASVRHYQGFVEHEIVLVNDASTDASGCIAEAFVQDRPDVQLISHARNMGLAEARNTLLAHATGDYIAWVDSDDCVAEDWFSELAKVLECRQPDVVAFELQSLLDSGLGDISSFGCDSFGMSGGESREVCAVEYACKVLQGLTILDYSPTRIVRRELHRGLSYRAPRGVWEDTIFAFDFLPRVKSVYYVAKPLYVYRQRSDSIMHTRKTENWLRGISFMRQTIANMKNPYRASATVHLMTSMRRVMSLAAKKPSDKILRAKASEFKRYYWHQLFLILFGRYIPLRRRIVDLLTLLPGSNVLLRRFAA